ncbi:MAG: endonuclease/exonuclease/phosphatase family protein [Aggregatilineales bacterium]
MSRWTQALRRAFAAAAALYALGLLAYLLLRLAAGDRWWWLAFLHNFAPFYFAPLLILLPTALLLRDRASAFRLLPLLAVGALWFGPLWLPDNADSAAAAHGANQLEVASFNILYNNPRLDDAIAWLRAADADIVLLQEVTPANRRRLLTALGDAYPYDDRQLRGTTQLTLSRLPLVSAGEVDLGRWWARRLEVDHGGQRVAVYNVHLPMPVGETRRLSWLPMPAAVVRLAPLELALHYNETQRNASLRALLDILVQEPLPFIAAGDFNTSDSAIIYGELRAALRDSFREAGWGPGATWPAGLGDDGLPAFLPPLVRIDYVWHSADFRALRAETGPPLGSDHLPLRVSLSRWPRPA